MLTLRDTLQVLFVGEQPSCLISLARFEKRVKTCGTTGEIDNIKQL